jgi:biotin carboxylase
MKLMILGAAKAQLNTIKRAKAAGHYVIASDYNRIAVGKEVADGRWLASTFDSKATYEGALHYGIDGIMTMGTDQPVLTVAQVAEKMHLPAFLSVETALAVTNKQVMKKIFIENNIPTIGYSLYQPGQFEDEVKALTYPVVVKPIDSQGQRGIYVLNSFEEVEAYYNEVIAYSREKFILVESFYENDEITVSGWVQDSRTTILTVTDRVTFPNKEQIGICLSHEFPSKHQESYQNEIEDLTKKIVEVFGIKNGPIYFQFFIGKDGLKVNEIACRIGGAYEDEFIPYLTGIDLLEMTINGSLGLAVDVEKLMAYNMKKVNKYLSAQLFFCKSGQIAYMPPEEEILELEGVISIGYHYAIHDRIEGINNATQRIGYVIVVAESKIELEERLKRLYDRLVILNEKDENLIIHREVMNKGPI